MKKTVLLFLAIAATVLTFAQKTTTKNVDFTYTTGLKWREVGPFRGGRSCAVTGVSGVPNLYYMGSTGGGVWRTTDAGNTWQNISDGYFGGSIGAIDVAKTDPNIIFVGTGEKTVRGNVSSGNGVYKSTDAGKTWQFLGLENSKHIGRVRIHPKNENIILVAAMGDLFKDSPDRGVYKTTDGGKTWRNVLFVDGGSGAFDLIIDPNNPRIMYASTWTHRRTPYSFSSGGAGCKLFKSTDAGETWNEISNNPGFASGLLGIIGITVSPANSNRLFAMVESEKLGGVYRSDDAGATWQRVNESRDLRQRAWYYSCIFADTKDENKVFVLNVSYHISTDGGKSFSAADAPHGDHHDLWIAPEDPNRMIISDDGGAQISFDGGKNWTTYFNQPTAQFYRVSVDDHFPFRIYGAQQDNSSIRIAHRSSDNAIGQKDWEETAGGEAGSHAIYPNNNDVVFGGEYGGLMIRLNHKTTDVQATNVYPDNPLGHGVENMKYRFQWNYPLFYSRHNPEKLYTFSNYVHTSTDFGRTWQTISPDLTTNDTTKQGPSGGPITKDNTAVEYYCTIFSAAESFTDSNVIWTGSDDGKIYLTQDGGHNWKDVSPKDLPPFTQINSIEADPHVPGGLFVAATRYKWGDNAPYLYYTKDFGKTWQRINNGIGKSDFTRTIRAVPNKENVLFAGTEHGMYVSFDKGGNWQSLQNNLPLVPITDLAVKENALVAATQGRGFWMIDDINPLLEMQAGFAPKAHLFTPKTAYIMQGNQGKPSLTEGQNHPNGAIFNYYLETVDTAAHTYQIIIKNEDGNVVRAFASNAKNKADVWLPKVGANDFVWNLREAGNPSPEGMILWFSLTEGAFSLPGNYVAVLKVDDKEQAVNFKVALDPRLETTSADLLAQRDFIKEISKNLKEVNDVVFEIKDVKTQLDAAKEKTTDAALLAEINAIYNRADEVQKALYQTQNRSAQDPLNYPVRLNNKYGHLGALANIGFNKPTAGMYAVKAALEVEIAAELQKWQVLKAEIATLDKKLRDANTSYFNLTKED